MNVEQLKLKIMDYQDIPAEQKEEYELDITICDMYSSPYYLVALEIKPTGEKNHD